MKKQPKSRIEEIIWKDHMHASGWTKPSGYSSDQLADIRSVGYILNEDKEVVRMFMSHDFRYENINQAQVIAKKMIVSRRVLRG